jgi:mitochondrial intermediate peptidase
VVSRFARHYKTGEALPIARLEALCAAKHTFAAAEMQQQVFYSALDQKLHMHPLTGTIRTTTDILQEVQQQYYGLPFVSNTVYFFLTSGAAIPNQNYANICLQGMATQI